MNEWKKVKLGDLLEEYCERNTNNEYTAVAIGKYGIRKREDIYTKELSKDISKNKIIMKNTLTIGMGSNQIDIGILTDDCKFCVSPAYTTYKIKKCNSKFLEYYMEYLNPKLSDLFMIVSARQGKSVDKEGLLKYEVMLPPIGEQEKIVEILKTIDSIIEKYESLLEEKNQFIKSLFVVMFENNECIEKKEIINICKSIVRGPFGSALKKEFFVPKGENTYKVYEQKNAINEDSSLGTYYIDENKFNELKRFECKPGDIIMSCSGTIGKIYQLPNDIEKGVINQALLKFTLDYSKVLPIYFLEFIKSNIQNLETKGTGLQNLGSVSYIKEMGIPVPTMEQQKQFVELVEQIDKQKFLLEKQKQNYENLKKGLMQKLLTGQVRVKI